MEGNLPRHLRAADEPINLTEWIAAESTHREEGRLFSCGRPGRAKYLRAHVQVDECTIDLWADGLLSLAEKLHIVCLLGSKPTGMSEFVYYPFRSSRESDTRPTFQEWLDMQYGQRFIIHEYPTTDARPIPPKIRETAASHVLKLIREGNTVIVVDSAGAERTARICESIGYVRA